MKGEEQHRDAPRFCARGAGLAPSVFFLVLFSFLFALFSFHAAPVFALKSDRDQPIHIRARAVQVNEKTGVAIYRGGVVLTQGSLTITAEHMEVHVRNHQTELILAIGQPATLETRLDGSSETLYARAQRLEYRVGERRVSLLGAAHVRQGGDRLDAEIAHYRLDEEQLEAEGGEAGRVHAVLAPRPGGGSGEGASSP